MRTALAAVGLSLRVVNRQSALVGRRWPHSHRAYRRSDVLRLQQTGESRRCFLTTRTKQAKPAICEALPEGQGQGIYLSEPIGRRELW
jgi:hypothetical protein